ncbi:hypothetical protein NPX13_g683 [Xylaria arbuscula]|uniref:Sialidase domain-containing protein n=1 Tax=Xylaria arbuscula TaxID=114810 RepID=A0A9W8TQW4_9PEZI|nr:hypothetical protein NPX13_g683 [Xylaria arbuscula]
MSSRLRDRHKGKEGTLTPTRTTLGADPAHRTCALNGYAFQQDALRTFKGWQYACFYSSPANGTSSAYPSEEPVYVHLLRRKLPAGNWETLVFADYAQTTDDGHNTVQAGTTRTTPSTSSRQGPNSAANNRDICYAWSSDGGTRWHSGGGNNADTSKCGEVIADLGKGESIVPSSPGIVAFTVPKGSGLINQEAQAVDCEGGVHVLNRDNLEASVMRWKHYYRSPQGTWTQRALPYVEGVYGGKRGQVAVSRDGDLYFVLPHHTDPMLTILRASKTSRYENYELVWQGGGIPPTEPLVDKVRLGQDNVLSIFTRMVSESRDSVDVVVIDFQL